MTNSADPEKLTLKLSQEGDRLLAGQAPLAAWACWQRALRVDPTCQAAGARLEELENSMVLPLIARVPPKFRNPIDEEYRKRWDEVLRDADLVEIEVAAKAFQTLSNANPNDANATYNLAICLAWQGLNLAAIEKLKKFIELTASLDFDAATEAAALAELLRHASDTIELSDDLTLVFTSQKPLMPDGLPGFIGPVDIPDLAKAADSGTRVIEWLTAEPVGMEPALLLATFVITPNQTQIINADIELLSKAWEVFVDGRDLSSYEIRHTHSPLPIELSDLAVWSVRVDHSLEPEVAAEIRRRHVERFYETRWIALPRKALASSGNEALTPLQASRSNDATRAMLAGLILFREQLSHRPNVAHLYSGYAFDRLRMRLGLGPLSEKPEEIEHLALLSEKELDILDPKLLDDTKLAEAFESAAAFGNDTRTSRFAAEMVDRDAESLGGIDRHALFAVLVREAVARDDRDLIHQRLDQAMAADAKHGGGRERIVFQSWRAEIYCRMGEPDNAVRVYREVFAEAPPSRTPEMALDAAESLEDNLHLDHALTMAKFALELAKDQEDHRIERLVLEMIEELEGS